MRSAGGVLLFWQELQGNKITFMITQDCLILATQKA
jgi:hypothetical protein